MAAVVDTCHAVNSADSCLNVGGILPRCGRAHGRGSIVTRHYGIVAYVATWPRGHLCGLLPLWSVRDASQEL